MRNYKILSGLLFVVLLAFSATSFASKAREAWRMIEHGALLVDVRTPKEYHEGHLPGALLIPHRKVASRIGEFGEDKNRRIVLYCKGGVRAAKAQRVLQRNGFTRVFNAGGYEAMMDAKPH
ncbi:MAG TPA: rhodanese-like domain-containing protein [Gammaproteobacteria bacterium]|nr:rhodanese-like domain-containing protein [Gammaproteobacteria bacterium]